MATLPEPALELKAIAPNPWRTALSCRSPAHLHLVATRRRRVAVLHRAEEHPTTDPLAALSNVADAPPLCVRRHAGSLVHHLVRRPSIIHRRQIGVTWR